jgi:hypothetical protein
MGQQGWESDAGEEGMKIVGSKQVKIHCRDCRAVSPPFRITLQKESVADDVGEFVWRDKDLPEGWQGEDEAELYDTTIYGYCPKHRWPAEA